MSAALAVLPMVWACASRPVLVHTAPEPEVVAKAAVEPSLAFYRKYTEKLLRHYMRSSMECGRVPSLLGKELFRAKASSYTMRNFEDVVIFVHDVEKCLMKLNRTQQILVARIALQEYTLAETAELLGIGRMTVARRYAEAVDRLTQVLLEGKLLEPQKACQEGENRK